MRRKGAKFISRFNKRAEIAFGKGQSVTGRSPEGPSWHLARRGPNLLVRVEEMRRVGRPRLIVYLRASSGFSAEAITCTIVTDA